ncbi:MAG: pilus assembly protein PilM [Kiritimatiellae bacterium]|nr:pilus assembly protein PilM [Kiritimatiellia bacterium]
MFSTDRILALDVGASKILLAEFSLKGPVPVLTGYASAELDPLSAGQPGADLFSSTAETVKALMAEKGFKPAPLHVMLPGQTVFPRFMKIPAASSDLVDNLVRDEAAENLPFPLDQVVWDYWRLGTDEATGELDALIVATKSETAADAAALADAIGCPLALVDAAPLALYNSVRFNCPEADGCTLVLDIGARATNLVFVEGSKVFMRTIPIAGNTVTHEIARTLGVEPAEAERIKKEIGFVALGGTYAVADDETADTVSKVVRNVATRLHSEVNRSINFYRSQQGGSAPDRMLLTGGTALTRHLDTFFQEKLGVEVSFFNPFTNLSVEPGLEEDSEGLFLMASVAGLALRAGAKCPVEINLIPPAIAEERRFLRRLPYFGGAVAAVVLSLLLGFLYANNLKGRYEKDAKDCQKRAAALKRVQTELSGVASEVDGAMARVDSYAAVALSRAAFPRTLDSIRSAMLPGMWLKSVSFSITRQNTEGEKPSAGTIRIVACGFKGELDDAVARPRRGRRARGGSPGELFCNSLLALQPKIFSSGSVVRETTTHGKRVAEIELSLALARPVGTPDLSWAPGRGGEEEPPAETSGADEAPETAETPEAPAEDDPEPAGEPSAEDGAGGEPAPAEEPAEEEAAE